MPKRGSDAASRIFFDQLVSLTASRLKASGAIRLEDRHGFIAFGDEDHGGERRKSIGVAHTKFPNGGAWSYFICPRCGGRKKKLWLVEDAPRCLSCCWSLGVRYRSAYGFGRGERLRERDHYVGRVQDRRLRGRKRRLTITMRRSTSILERSATGLRESDLNVLSKLGNQGLEGRLEPEAFTGGEVGGEDDLLDFLVGCPVYI